MQLTKKELEAKFDLMLDTTEKEVTIGFLKYSPSQVLKRVDPMSYYQMFLEWCYENESKE